MRNENERVIYSNEYDWITEEEVIESIVCNKGFDNDDFDKDEITEREIYDEKAFLEEIYFDDEMSNLDIPTDGRIIAIADMGLWNGRVSGYSICESNVNEVLTVGNNDIVRVYHDKYDVKKISHHHDGTNYITFREIREDRDIDKFITSVYNGEEISRQKLNYYTKSLVPYINEVFGDIKLK